MSLTPGESFRPRVLVIAEEANPEWASVPLVGWSHAKALTDVADVHLVTQIRNRDALLRAGLVENRDFTAIDSEAVIRPLYQAAQKFRGGAGLGWTTVSAFSTLGYYFFEGLVWRRFRARVMSGEFDLVHRLTPLSPTTPSMLSVRCRRARVPFVLGPLNGGLPWPVGFDRVRRKEREWLSYVRSAFRLLPLHRSTLRNASAVIAASQSTWSQVAPSCRERCIYIPENAVDPARFPTPAARGSSDRLSAVFLGRMVPYKGPDMLLEAAAPLLKERRLELSYIGDGPMRPELEGTVKSQGLQDGVRFLGWVAQSEVHRSLGTADVLAFPSIREFGGAVALEAMASGAVPIVMDYGGPAELVSDATGYRIPMGTRSQIVERLRATLIAVCTDPGELKRRRDAGHKRVLSQFTWEAKAHQVLEIYRWVLGQRPDKPDFGMPFPDIQAS